MSTLSMEERKNIVRKIISELEKVSSANAVHDEGKDYIDATNFDLIHDAKESLNSFLEKA